MGGWLSRTQGVINNNIAIDEKNEESKGYIKDDVIKDKTKSEIKNISERDKIYGNEFIERHISTESVDEREKDGESKDGEKGRESKERETCKTTGKDNQPKQANERVIMRESKAKEKNNKPIKRDKERESRKQEKEREMDRSRKSKRMERSRKSKRMERSKKAREWRDREKAREWREREKARESREREKAREWREREKAREWRERGKARVSRERQNDRIFTNFENCKQGYGTGNFTYHNRNLNKWTEGTDGRGRGHRGMNVKKDKSTMWLDKKIETTIKEEMKKQSLSSGAFGSYMTQREDYNQYTPYDGPRMSNNNFTNWYQNYDQEQNEQGRRQEHGEWGHQYGEVEDDWKWNQYQWQ